MPNPLSILYRGPLASCNYDCSYCPFAKRHDTAAQLALDRRQLERFASWMLSRGSKTPRGSTTSVFFTPWGEALTRSWYVTAIQQLSHADHVPRIAAQTNLSCSLDWLADCETSRIGLWCTYHRSQISRDEFLSKCESLNRLDVAHSVGVVGIPDDYQEIEDLRKELPDSTYLWINAWDVADGQKYDYSEDELQWLESIDPQFRMNTIDHPSLGKMCDCGTNVISVDGEGTIRRCHFVRNPIGNIYDDDFEQSLVERGCPNTTCGCHIGYVHLPELNLQPVYGDGILERVPRLIPAPHPPGQMPT